MNLKHFIIAILVVLGLIGLLYAIKVYKDNILFQPDTSATPNVTSSITSNVTPSITPGVTSSVTPGITSSITPGTIPSTTPSMGKTVWKLKKFEPEKKYDPQTCKSWYEICVEIEGANIKKDKKTYFFLGDISQDNYSMMTVRTSKKSKSSEFYTFSKTNDTAKFLLEYNVNNNKNMDYCYDTFVILTTDNSFDNNKYYSHQYLDSNGLAFYKYINLPQ